MKSTIAIKNKYVKKAARILASVLALLLLLVAAGMAYAWYTGNQPAPQASQVSAPPAPRPIEHVKPAANARVGVAVQTISSPLKPGATADITIRTLPEAKCTIMVSYDKEKTPIKAAGLVPQTADDFGMASWKWVVDPAAPKGKWPVTVTCKKNKRSAVVTADLIVKP